ncbi:MAG TPA: diguanylate cyclase [Motilibacteraceae bacterium]|nr:diguanylate cyclase [Motilibacteraceae bacterium]
MPTFRALVERAPAPLLVVTGGTVAFANPAARTLFGPQVEGRRFADLFSDDARAAAATFLGVVRARPGEERVFLGTATAPDGRQLVLEARASALDIGPQAGAGGALVVALHDSSAAAERERGLLAGSTIDPLTGLVSWSLLWELLRQAHRSGSTGQLVLVDLDGFGELNDEHGHGAGDLVLRAVGERLEAVVGTAGTVGRRGTDDFAVLLAAEEPVSFTDAAGPPGPAGPLGPGAPGLAGSAASGLAAEEPAQLVQRLLDAVAAPVLLTGEGGSTVQVRVTACAGLAAVAGTPSPDAVVRNAELSLLAAQALGHGRAEVYGPHLHSWAQDRRDLAAAVVDLRRDNARLRSEARTDALTGLPNRRALDEELERQAAATRRSGRPLSVVFVDLDRFSEFNHRYGDAAGDVALRRLARVLGSGVRTADRVYRKGGEEFVCLLPDTSLPDALDVAERLRLLVRELEIPHTGTPSGVATVSAGVATSAGPATDPGELLAQAAVAAFRAKELGRDLVVAAGVPQAAG